MFRGFGLLLVGLVLAGCISAGIGSDANALAANLDKKQRNFDKVSEIFFKLQ